MKQGDEVLYSIIVPGLTGYVNIEHARKVINEAGCSIGLIHIGGDAVSVPRLFTFWRGDEAEKLWQAQIKAALPSALFDVKPWSHAPGYPQGEEVSIVS